MVFDGKKYNGALACFEIAGSIGIEKNVFKISAVILLLFDLNINNDEDRADAQVIAEEVKSIIIENALV